MPLEKLIFREPHQKSPTYRHVTKLLLESEFQHEDTKEINKRKPQILNKILYFSRQQQIKKIKLFKHYIVKDKKWTELSSLGQEPTFKKGSQLFKFLNLKMVFTEVAILKMALLSLILINCTKRILHIYSARNI